MPIENFIAFIVFSSLIAFHDIRSFRIPDRYSLPGIAIGFGIAVWKQTPPMWSCLTGIIAGYALFYLVRLVTGNELGQGDLKLSAMVGAFFGILGWMITMFFASLFGIAYAFALRIRDRKMWKAKLPFAPFIVLGGIVAYFVLPEMEKIVFSGRIV